MRLAPIVVLVALGAGLSGAEEEKGPQPPTAVAEAFLAAVQKGEIDAAIERLTTDSPLHGKAQELALLKSQTQSILPIYGAMLGFERIKNDTVGSSIVHLVFVARHEKHPIAWRFVFYKPKDRWLIDFFKWSDSYEGLL
jgi:hypothetical protein